MRLRNLQCICGNYNAFALCCQIPIQEKHISAFCWQIAYSSPNKVQYLSNEMDLTFNDLVCALSLIPFVLSENIH